MVCHSSNAASVSGGYFFDRVRRLPSAEAQDTRRGGSRTSASGSASGKWLEIVMPALLYVSVLVQAIKKIRRGRARRVGAGRLTAGSSLTGFL